MNSRLATPESNALALICREWYISFGAMTLVVVLSLWIHPLWMPLCEIGLAIVLALLGPGRNISAGMPCGRITLVTIYSLLFTGLISFMINVAYHTKFIHLFFDITTLNHSIPYITSLVIFPVCTVIILLLNSRFLHMRHVRNCHLHNQYNPSQPMFGRMVHATYRSLLNKMVIITAVISVIDYTYYFLYYRNISINKPDKFFFFFVPAAIFLWSIFFVRSSYSSLVIGNGRKILAKSDSSQKVSTITDSAVTRFLVVRDGKLLLDVSESAIQNCSVDTPFTEIKPSSYKGSAEHGRKDFEYIAKISNFDLRLLYESNDKLFHNRCYHYLVTLPEYCNVDLLPGEWVGIDGIDRLMKMGVLNPLFTDEIYRIYTIAMAWKTYDKNGKRKFPIRNYRPNFRLEDLQGYDADFQDDHWLKVSRINQDKRLWFIRRFLLNKK